MKEENKPQKRIYPKLLPVVDSNSDKYVLTHFGRKDARGQSRCLLIRFRYNFFVVSSNCGNHFLLQCLNADRIFAFHSVGENASADVSEFSAMTPTVLYQLQNPACRAAEPHREPHHSPPAPQGKL